MAKPANIAFQVVVVVLVLAVLGVGIGVLVTVINIQNKDSKSATTAAPTTAGTKATPPTDPTTTSTTTAATPPIDDGGIPPVQVIAETDNRYGGFSRVDNILKTWMDTTINPCDDFFHYVCKGGQDKNATDITSESEIQNTAWQLDAYKNAAYFADKPLPLKQLKRYFDKCVTTDATEAQRDVVVRDKVTAFKAHVGAFPLVFQDETVTALSPEQIGQIIGFASNDVGADSLFPIFIDSDLSDPVTFPARPFIDQPQPIFGPVSHTAWTQSRPQLIKHVKTEVAYLRRVLDITDPVNDAALTAAAGALVDMDHAIFAFVSYDTSRDANLINNPLTLTDLQTSSPQINWIEFLKAALTRANAPDSVVAGLTAIVAKPVNTNGVAALIPTFAPATIANYIQYRVFQTVYASMPALVKTPADNAPDVEEMRRLMHPKRKPIRAPKRKPINNDIVMNHPILQAQYTKNERSCYSEVREAMAEAGDRVFVDQAWPTPEDRAGIKSQVTALATWVIQGFRSQLDVLNWMSDETKQFAYQKLDQMYLNVAYEDFIYDDAALNAFYAGLAITTESTTMQVYQSYNDYVLTKSVANFRLQAQRDRESFGSGVGICNAWYQPEENSMNIPGGILHNSFYDVNFPAAFNLGIQASVLGHELTHGFDDEGVQWNNVGGLQSWMDPGSKTSFDAMAQCVIDQYSGYCPVPEEGPLKPAVCLNGKNTQGENIADNGGMQAGYKAFKAYEALFGPDPRLPSFGKVFNTDQLYFIGFAYSWCQAEETADEYRQQIKVDVHSPALYRVLGTLANFPAFRNAFNCPVPSTYAPPTHCDVWTSKPKAKVNGQVNA